MLPEPTMGLAAAKSGVAHPQPNAPAEALPVALEGVYNDGLEVIVPQLKGQETLL